MNELEFTDTKAQMGRNAQYTAMGVLLSSLFGFLLYISIGRIFGAGKMSDAFFAANILWILFLTFASTFRYTLSVLLAPYDEAEDFRKKEASILLSVIVFIIPLCLLIYIFSPYVSSLLGIGFDEEKVEITLNLVKILIPGFFFVSVGFVFSSSLGARGIFSIPAIALASLNCFAFLVFLLFRSKLGIYSVAFGLTIGSLSFFIILLLGILRKNLFPIFERSSSPFFFNTILGIFAGAGIYVFNQINYWIIQSFSSLFSEGIPTIFAYSSTIIAFLVYIVAFPISVVSAPSMKRQQQDIEKYFTGALRYNSLFSIPISIVLFLFADSLAGILFENSFSPQQITTFSSMLKIYTPVIIVGGTALQFFSLFFSMDMKGHLFSAGALSIPINILFLSSLSPFLSFYSLMVSQLCFTIFIVIYLAFWLPSKRIKLSNVLSAIVQGDVILCAFLSAVVIIVLRILFRDYKDYGFLFEILKISFGGVIYFLSFFVFMKLVRPSKYEELRELMTRRR
ncbi:MAG: hypothetical protein D6734_00430 [Candidatus Schekmanbacteria bacterium]|nr:MAG: hypothetical protein D6734_00430 [Candidatus Schekmanbacteria bacterium]